jgi:hypothetical protein
MSSSSSTPAMNASASPARIGVGPAEPIHAHTARRSGQMAIESEQTAMTIALRVPIFANCWGPVAGRQVEGGDQLVLAGRLALGAGDELRHRQAARARRAGQLDLRVGDVERRQAVAGRGCGAEVAAHRPAVADLRRAHGARGDGQAGQALAELLDEARVGDAGADPQAPVVGAPVAQFGHAGEVEDGLRTGPIEVQRHHEVGAAGDRDGFGLRRLHGQRLLPGVGYEDLHRFEHDARMQTSRGVRGLSFTLVTPANHYPSRLPAFGDAPVVKLVTPRMAPARMGQYLVSLPAGEGTVRPVEPGFETFPLRPRGRGRRPRGRRRLRAARGRLRVPAGRRRLPRAAGERPVAPAHRQAPLRAVSRPPGARARCPVTATTSPSPTPTCPASAAASCCPRPIPPSTST